MSGPSPGHDQGRYDQDPASFYDQQQQSFDPQQQYNMNTVFEEEEPVSSPELGRGDQQWTQEQYDYYQQEQQGQAGQAQYDYSENGGGYDGYDYGNTNSQTQQQQQQQSQQPVDQSQWEPPYYPGYLYDAASNSYISDPNWQPPSTEGQSTPVSQAQQSSGNVEESYGGGGGGGGQQQAWDDGYGNQGGYGPGEENTAESEQEEGDPYANDPYQFSNDAQDPYAQYQPSNEQGQQFAEQTAAYEPTTQPDQQQYEATDPYSTDQNQYGYHSEDQGGYQSQNADPYTVESKMEEEDPYSQDEPLQEQYAAQDVSYGQQNEPYDQQADYYDQQSQASTREEEPSYYDDRRKPQSNATQNAPPPRAPPPASRSTDYAPSQRTPEPYRREQERERQPSSRETSSSRPPAQSSSRRSEHSPPPQQQYTSFASAYDASSSPTDSKEAPYDPYAPVPKQTRDRAYSGASNLSNRSRPSPAQAQAQIQSQALDPYMATTPTLSAYGADSPSQSQGAYDPYAVSSSLPVARSQPPPASPALLQQQKPTGPPPASIPPKNLPTGSASAPRLSALSPPPRSSSAQSNRSQNRESQQETAALRPSLSQNLPPPKSTNARPPPSTAPPQRSSQPAFDIPPPRSTIPPAQQRNSTPAQAKPSPSTSARPPPSSLAANPAPTSASRARSPSATSIRAHESQQSTSSSTSNSSNYIAPPPSAPSSRGPPPSQQKPLPFGGVLQPPARRAPHQRGASAFGSDSPYGALPTGPLTSMYEPSGSGVDQIKEEAEEEDMPEQEQEQEQEQVQAEADPQEHFVPSWMQATSNAPPPNDPYRRPDSSSAQPNRSTNASQAPTSRPPPSKPSAARPVDSLTDSFAKVSLSTQGSDPSARQVPPPNRGAPPIQLAQPPQPPRQIATQGSAPPRQSAPSSNPSAPLPKQNASAPLPRSQPPPQSMSRPPPREANVPPARRQNPPPQNAAPPRQNPPPPAQAPYRQPPRPQQQQQPIQPPASSYRPPVPQLHFEPPSNEREYRSTGPTRPPPPAGQGSRSTTPVPMMVVEETAEEEEQQSKSYENEGQTESMQSEEGGYEVDEHATYGESTATQTGATTPSTTYGGDWQADGYDYVSQQHAPYDPYAPQPHQNQPHDPYQSQQAYQYQNGETDEMQAEDEDEEEDSLTPAIQQEATFSSPYQQSSPRKQPEQRQQRMPTDPRASNTPYGQSSNSYAPVAPPQTTHSYQDQQAYDPYAASRPGPASRQGSYSNETAEIADLGLERRQAPLVSFGFGGRMLVVFPGRGDRFNANSAYDAANPYSMADSQPQPSTPTTVHIRKLDDILPPSHEAPFPGPIFLDGGKANSGKKRKEALAWLGKRIQELEEEINNASSHFASDSSDSTRRNAKKRETRLILVNLVKIFIENEGKLVGSPAVDDAVRAVLIPSAISLSEPTSLPTADQLASNAANTSDSRLTAPFATYGVSSTNLDEMTTFLLRGERREAVQYALEHKMWAHAFIIASCIDTDCWKDVTMEFLRSELTPSQGNQVPGAEGREALRVAYSMFAGLGAESIEQFIPPRTFSDQSQSQLLPAAPIGTSSQSGFESRSKLSDATLATWRDTVGMIVSNRTAGDSAALTALGDALASNDEIEAAHVCYLLSPQTSLVGGIGSLNSRISLVGSAPSLSDGINLESVKLTELLEFGCSLTPTVKGQETFTGFPHLQAYRLQHASLLADSGDIQRSLKYTEAVVNTLKLATRPSPFYHPRLVAQVKHLGERIGAAPGQKETSSWIARKVPRPTVNSLWSTFEGGFSKFVSGEDELSPAQLAAKAEVAKVANGQPIGPFSHYSAIAPDSNSGTLSRAQSSTDLNGGGGASSHLLHSQPPMRPRSAAAPVPPSHPSPQSSKPVHSPGPPPVKRAPFKTHHARSSSLGAFAGYDFNPTAPPPWQSYTPAAPARAKVEEENGLTDSPRESMEASERPKSQLAPTEDRFSEDASGFISPMAQYTPSVSPTPGSNRSMQPQNPSHRRMTTAEELADLGIGNSKSKKPSFDTLDEELEAEEGGAPPRARDENSQNPSESAPNGSSSKNDDKPTIKPSKSWLGGWFKREASPAAQIGPGPVKANLGDQKTFYYDEKLKRWINNSGKGGDETPPSIVPPPRASTASPSRAMRGSPRFGSPAPPVPPMPPQRSQTTGPPPLSRSATSSDLRSQTPYGELRPPSRPSSAADGAQGGRPNARRNKPKYVAIHP